MYKSTSSPLVINVAAVVSVNKNLTGAIFGLLILKSVASTRMQVSKLALIFENK